ncbi:MAG: hypothetical protein ABL893_19030, partial [Hyphomicrobium sp.]
DAGSERAALEDKIRNLETEARDNASEMLKMKAALKAFADSASDPATGRTSAALSAKVEISQLQAEVTEHRSTIESLRAEIASSNERLVRQAQHFRDELRRLGGGALTGDRLSRNDAEPPPRRSLAERIAAPRVPQPASNEAAVAANDEGMREARTPTGTFLKALKGGSGDAPSADAIPDTPDGSEPPRRARLLDRIGGVDKQN